MLSESSHVSKQSDAFANHSSQFPMSFWASLNTLICVINLAQMNIRNGKKGFANASDYLEAWDDSDNITAVNAQRDLRHLAKMVA